MLTNTERQQIVEEVNAGTYGIDEALDDIAAAQKGEEVRKALYAEALVLNREGHAGSTDMIARQQIANLQTSVNGQISTLRTEVGDDIDDLETALNSGLATQNGKIAAQDATIANVVANYNVEYGSTELWASTGETGALAAGTTVTLSEDVSHFDYIDIYSFLGNNNILDTLPVDAKLQSNDGYALRWVNLSDPGSGTYEAYVRIIETKIKIIGTTLTIIHQVTYSNGASVSISGAEITQSNRSTYVGELGIMKVVGRKITANTEIEDVRVGADGTEYNSAGQAVRAQISDIKSELVEYKYGGGWLSDEARRLLLVCLSKVAWIDGNGQDYCDQLEDALFAVAKLDSISAIFTQPSVNVYDDWSLDDLRSHLVVTAAYDDSSTQTVTAYTLSGTLSVGTSTITVSYGGKTTTFTVTVSAPLYSFTVGTHTCTNPAGTVECIDRNTSKIVMSTANSNDLHACMSNPTSMTTACNSTNNYLNGGNVLFTIPAGSTVRTKVIVNYTKNCVASMKTSSALRSAGGTIELVMITDAYPSQFASGRTFEATGTFENATDIVCVGTWFGTRSNQRVAAEISETFVIYVGDVRYI